jgi:hypothetical protein
MSRCLRGAALNTSMSEALRNNLPERSDHLAS